jgi:hypothetical protein
MALNVILPSAPWSPKLSLHLKFSFKVICHFHMRATRPTHHTPNFVMVIKSIRMFTVLINYSANCQYWNADSVWLNTVGSFYTVVDSFCPGCVPRASFSQFL